MAISLGRVRVVGRNSPLLRSRPLSVRSYMQHEKSRGVTFRYDRNRAIAGYSGKNRLGVLTRTGNGFGFF